jgi:ABC-type molybdate transport system substrate-binding protein
MVILRYGKDKEGYEKFYNFILSAESRKILEKYGYILP